MIPDIIAFAISHPFVAGLAIGGMSFGGSLGIVGWCLGYEAAMRRVGSWMRATPRPDEAHGDMPTLPPARQANAIVGALSARVDERCKAEFKNADPAWGGR